VNARRTVGRLDPYLTVRRIGRVIVGETSRLDRTPSVKRLPPPAHAEPPVESTAELVAAGPQSPLVTTKKADIDRRRD
jgi:hypothetical protein